MIKLISTNITSPLGKTTEQNYKAMLAGESALTECSGKYGIPESMTASLFSASQVDSMYVEGFSEFESMVIHSVSDALDRVPESCAFDVASPRTLFILCSTKADVKGLEYEMGLNADPGYKGYSSPGICAKRIASYLGFTTDPVVVCNACISGVSGQVVANRLIHSGVYDNVIVCGADKQCLFTMAGFLSLKAMSKVACRPFDIERNGLNLGESAATMIISRVTGNEVEPYWTIKKCHLDNDSYHISTPSPDGDGVIRGISVVAPEQKDKDRIGAICAHGTATMFNDQMESKAISGSGCSDIPIFALKGIFGHTLGASGVLETILGLRSMDDGIIPSTLGYEEIGVSGKVNICSLSRKLSCGKTDFLKIISGFGGCNGAVLWHKVDICSSNEMYEAEADVDTYTDNDTFRQGQLKILRSVRITPDCATLEGQSINTSSSGKALLTELYKLKIGNYPKFYKMDVLSRLVIVATELLVKEENLPEQTAVVLFNSSSSIVSDRSFIKSIWDGEDFLPSPSAFVYTLPNIATGEVAIKHGYKGETTLYILDHKDDNLMQQVVVSTLADHSTTTMITGWVDCSDVDVFEADLKLITIK